MNHPVQAATSIDNPRNQRLDLRCVGNIGAPIADQHPGPRPVFQLLPDGLVDPGAAHQNDPIVEPLSPDFLDQQARQTAQAATDQVDLAGLPWHGAGGLDSVFLPIQDKALVSPIKQFDLAVPCLGVALQLVNQRRRAFLCIDGNHLSA
ncbi:hypothetical protein D3C85_681250 [compost metagenome]